MRCLLMAIALVAAPAYAQNVVPRDTYAAMMANGIPVTDGDVLDRPYRVIETVTTNVRQTTVFGGTPSLAKAYRELWEKAQRIGADAVVHAYVGEGRITAWSWNARQAQGQAIKFLTPSEVAALKPPK